MTKFTFTNFIYLIYIIFFFLTLFLLINISNHPVIIISIILIYRSLICLNISIWKPNFILSIFLFLIIIRGLLIIFLYFSSLISNNQFNFKINPYYLIPLIPLRLTIIYFLIKINPLNLFIYKYKFNENSPIHAINKINFNNILNLYEYPLSNLTSLSIFYLLISLFSIIKICSLKSSTSLRKIN